MRALRFTSSLSAALLAAASPALGQRADSVRSAVAPAPRSRRAAPAPDTTPRPPIAPRRAFLYSALVPGLGQAKLQRYNAGALFVTIEMASLAMAAKSRADLRQGRRLYRDSVIVSYAAPDTSGVSKPTYQTCLSSRNAQLPVCPITQDRIRARRLHVEDWVAAVLFNHLFAGADAFVAAQLWDLPTQVSARPTGRGVEVSAQVTW